VHTCHAEEAINISFPQYKAGWKWRPSSFHTLRIGTRHRPALSDTRLLFVHKTQTGLEEVPFFCSYAKRRPDSKWYPSSVRTQDTDWPVCDTCLLFVHKTQTWLEVIPIFCSYTTQTRLEMIPVSRSNIRHRPARNNTCTLFVRKTQTGLEVISFFCSYTRHRSGSKWYSSYLPTQ
jgi:hypothetical protein